MFTVGITNHNYGRFLRRAVESALGAEQVIVVDDASSDDSRDIIAEYPVEAILHDEPSGSCVLGYQEIIERAEGDWLIMLDADDYLMPAWKQTYSRYDGDWLVCDLALVDEHDRITGTTPFEGWPMDAESAFAFARERKTLPVSMKGAFSTRFLREHDLSFYAWETNHYADDCRTCLEYLKYYPRITHVPLLLYAYRIHGSQGSKDREEHKKFIRDITAYFEGEPCE